VRLASGIIILVELQIIVGFLSSSDIAREFAHIKSVAPSS
jgi:hypothetical protein